MKCENVIVNCIVIVKKESYDVLLFFVNIFDLVGRYLGKFGSFMSSLGG